MLRHFIHHIGCSREKPAILFMDNHESHLGVQVLEIARTNGLTILTFPPHTSHRLQPLDVSVYGPLKAYYKKAVNEWNVSSPGKRITIYDLPECLSRSFYKAMTHENISSGFRKTGIYLWPLTYMASELRHFFRIWFCGSKCVRRFAIWCSHPASRGRTMHFSTTTSSWYASNFIYTWFQLWRSEEDATSSEEKCWRQHKIKEKKSKPWMSIIFCWNRRFTMWGATSRAGKFCYGGIEWFIQETYKLMTRPLYYCQN